MQYNDVTACTDNWTFRDLLDSPLSMISSNRATIARAERFLSNPNEKRPIW